MARYAGWMFGAALGATLLAGSAYADDDDALKSLIADCGGPNVANSDIDSCLERAREIGETAPSPQLQSLTARLERRAEAAMDQSDQQPPAEAVPAPAVVSSGPGGGSPADTGASIEKTAPHA